MQFDFSTLKESLKRKAQNELTKCAVLQISAQVYDPHGLLAPVIIPMKCIFQTVCKQMVGWDSILSPELSIEWNKLLIDLSNVSTVQFPRFMLPDIELESKSVNIHGFSDASQRAYGACVYVRIEHDKGIDTQLLGAKSRIAPLKGQTIPCMELMATALLAEFISKVVNALRERIQIRNIRCWTDSQVVLWWIRTDSKQQKPFIENQLTQIRNAIEKRAWEYCPTYSNPADLISRGTLCSQLIKSQLWWTGLSILLQNPDNWPTFNGEIEENVIKQTTLIAPQFNVVNISKVIECTEHSNLDKLFRVTALVLRFIKLVKKSTAKETQNHTIISKDDLDEAKPIWYKEVQKDLVMNAKVDSNLSVFEDKNGIYRVKGRIDNAPLPYDTKFPVLLPRNHHVTYLSMFKAHEIVKHNGIAETLTQLRSEYWVCKGGQVVKTLLSKCCVYKRIMGTLLPLFMVSEDLAFSKIAVDFAGPLYVQNIYESNNTHKCYIALFTCASTRGIHLELGPDLNSSSFIRSLSRFIGRRGLPALLISDNGKTFTDSAVQRFVNSKNITWKFNIPTARWYGGFFESLVKLTNRCLKKTIGNTSLTYEELETVLIETKGILNSRPLTFIYGDILQPPLTLLCLVIGCRILDTSSVSNETENSDQKVLTKCARYLETLLRHFFGRWKNGYLPALHEHHKKNKNSSLRFAQVGDVVSIRKDKYPRRRWPLGIITKLIPGKQGCHAATVRTLDNAKKTICIDWPLKKLYPLEI